MKKMMPLRRVVTQITYEAAEGDDVGIRRAIKSWHNRLANGSIPRHIVIKLGRELFLDLDAWEAWWAETDSKTDRRCVGRPRSLSDSKMKSSINSDRIFYKTAAMARFVSVDS